MKLTEAQMRALRRMGGGDELWTVGGRNPSVFWHDSLADRAPSFATLHALERSGAIENYDAGWTGRKYRITESGRRALAQEGE